MAQMYYSRLTGALTEKAYDSDRYGNLIQNRAATLGAVAAAQGTKVDYAEATRSGDPQQLREASYRIGEMTGKSTGQMQGGAGTTSEKAASSNPLSGRGYRDIASSASAEAMGNRSKTADPTAYNANYSRNRNSDTSGANMNAPLTAPGSSPRGNALDFYNPIDTVNKTVRNLYVPEGEYMQQELKNVKVGGSESGELAWYEKLGYNEAGRQRMTVNPDTGALESFMLIGGGGRNTAQSGMVTLAAATPAVFERGGVQRGAAGLTNPEVMAPELESSGLTGIEVYNIVAGGNEGQYDTRDYLSRLGAEAYGGVVGFTDGRTLGSVTYENRSNRADWNLARYFDPMAVNRGKSDLPGANIPWSVGEQTPGFFFMDKNTRRGEDAPAYGGIPEQIGVYYPSRGVAYEGGNIVGVEARSSEPRTTLSGSSIRYGDIKAYPETEELGRLTGSKTVASVPTYGREVSDLPGQVNSLSKGCAAKFGQASAKLGGVDAPTFGKTAGSPAASTTMPAPFISKSSAPASTSKIGFDVPGMGFVGFDTPEFVKAGGTRLSEFESGIRTTIPSAATGEAAIKMGQRFNPFTAPVVGSVEIATVLTEKVYGAGSTQAVAAKEREDVMYSLTPLAGQYQTFYEHPTMAGVSLAAGVGFGVFGGTASKAYSFTRASIAEKVISEGGKWRKAEQGMHFAATQGPRVLGALYAADVGYRATEGGTNLAPASVVTKTRGLVMQEAVPMGIGFGIGYQGTTSAISAGARAARGISEVMAGQPGTTSRIVPSETPFTGKTFFERTMSNIPTITQVKGKYIEWRTPQTAMASGTGIYTVSGRPAPNLGFAGGRSRANPALARNAANMEFYAGRLASRPSGPSQATGKIGYIMTKAQPENLGTITMTGLGGETGVTGFVTGNKVLAGKDFMPTQKPVRMANIVAKRSMREAKMEAPSIDITTKSGSGLAIAQKAAMAPQELMHQQMSAPRSQGLYQYQGRQRGYAESYEYESVQKLPPGMQRPLPARQELVTEFSPISATESRTGLMLMQEQRIFPVSMLAMRQVPLQVPQSRSELVSAQKPALGLASSNMNLNRNMIDQMHNPALRSDEMLLPGLATTQRTSQLLVPALITVPRPTGTPTTGTPWTPPTRTPRVPGIDIPFKPVPDTPWNPPRRTTILIPGFGAPMLGGGGGSGSGYRRGTSWVNVHAVGAERVVESRWSMPVFRKMKFPKFKF